MCNFATQIYHHIKKIVATDQAGQELAEKCRTYALAVIFLYRR